MTRLTRKVLPSRLLSKKGMQINRYQYHQPRRWLAGPEHLAHHNAIPLSVEQRLIVLMMILIASAVVVAS
jgi:hypothetical protein